MKRCFVKRQKKRKQRSQVQLVNQLLIQHLIYHAAAILSATESGYTARIVSKYRPKSPIVAVTSNERVIRKLNLVWGVNPILGKHAQSTDEMLESTIETALTSGAIMQGDLVVITAGVPVGETGTTNIMKVHVIGEVVAKGQGIGRRTAAGRVVVAKSQRRQMKK